MKRISDWPIAARLGAGFGLMAVLLAVVVAVGALSLGDARDNTKKVTALAELSDGFTGFQSTITQLMELDTTIGGYANSGALGEPEPQEAIEQFTTLTTAVGEDEIAAITRQLTPAEQQLMEDLGAPFEGFVGAHTKMVKAYGAGQLEVGNDARVEGRELAEQASALSGRIADSITKRSAAASQQVEDETTSAQRLMLIIGGVAVLMALALGFLIARSVKRPAGPMVRAARGLAEGDVDQDVDLHSKDELGQMADAFRGVIDYQRELTSAATRVADGDLTVEVEPKSERDALGTAFKTMVANVRDIVGRMSQTATALTEASQQMANTSEEAGRAVGEIAHAVGEVAQGAERQVRTVDGARASAQETALAAQEAREIADQGAQTSAEATQAMQAVNESTGAINEAMKSLSDKSDEIGGIVSTIGGIAEQTNLLALNAAIEAARAGDQGRGFAVVAEEVRKLAEESQTAAGTISSLIEQIQGETARTVELVEEGARRSSEGSLTVEQAREAFERISVAVSDVGTRISAIAEATNEVAAVAEQSSASTEQVSASTQQTSASTQQIAASAQELARTAEELERLVGSFDLAAR
ncbi:MAG TPA: methyl-accepting chemotaxis protein [Capillimicrobium sp.]